MTSIFQLFWSFLAKLFAPATDPQPAATTEPAPTAPTEAGPLPRGDVEVVGIYARYAERAPAENIPYDQIDPNINPKVWVVARGTQPGAVVFGLQVDGRMPEADEIQTDGTVVEATGDPVIVVLDYPKYTTYRKPGTHDVRVLLGYAAGDGRTVTWQRSVPFTVRTVARNE